jgi:histidyl-tRNA synthetase
LDAEVIALAYDTIASLDLKGVVVKVNTLGDDKSKEQFKQALANYLLPFENQLSEDSKQRLHKNPLRILDSKDPQDKDIVKHAPKPIDHLTEEAKSFFDQVIFLLKQLKVPVELDPQLVRGLDYYSHTVFEIQAQIEGFGSQNALGGGGRYQSLVKELGGPDLPGIGFAFGMERLLLALEAEGLNIAEEDPVDVYFIAMDQKSKTIAQVLMQHLRSYGFKTDMNYSNKAFKGQLKHALRLGSQYMAIIGEDELNENVVSLKNTQTQQQEKVAFEHLADHLLNLKEQESDV